MCCCESTASFQFKQSAQLIPTLCSICSKLYGIWFGWKSLNVALLDTGNLPDSQFMKFRESRAMLAPSSFTQ